MSMGKRGKESQESLWIESRRLAQSPGHPFYGRLNRLLEEHGFDTFVEDLCRGFYADTMGRPSVPPGVYFRLLLVGYFEGLNAERAMAWRLADSLSLRQFCGYELTDSTPDHSTISRTRRLLDEETHSAVFDWVLSLLSNEGLVQGKTIGVDTTTLEANAAMRSIVRRDTGASYTEYLQSLAAAEGEPDLSREELARRDRRRKKKTSNKDWKNPYDPDAKITRMKDGRTHLAYKAEHAVDLEHGTVVAVTVQDADKGDTKTQEETLEETAERLANTKREQDRAAGMICEDESLLAEVVADRGYHSMAVIDQLEKIGIRSYIPEPKHKRRCWRNREELKKVVYANRRRTRGKRGKRLCRLRAEKVERSFAHCYETGGLRRLHTRGQKNARKRVLIHVAAFNLGLLMRKLHGFGTPRSLQGLRSRLATLLDRLFGLIPGSRIDGRPLVAILFKFPSITARVPMPAQTAA